jgi:hypothetical protein
MMAINFLWKMSSKFCGGEGPVHESMAYSWPYVYIMLNSLTVATGVTDSADAVRGAGGDDGEVEAVSPGIVGAGDIVLHSGGMHCAPSNMVESSGAKLYMK